MIYAEPTQAAYIVNKGGSILRRCGLWHLKCSRCACPKVQVQQVRCNGKDLLLCSGM